MMRDLYNSLPLPDDRPVTSLCVIEEISGCPPNYTVISKSHDQDIDADLCKDGFFKRITRYLCHSKTEGYFGYVIESVRIVNDKESRPPGYTIVEQTMDTGQRAFRKKQLCYKAVPRHMASQIITDIIILSKSKIAPEGFTLFGEMNGLSVCCKVGASSDSSQPQNPLAPSSSLPYNVNPNGRGTVSGTSTGMYPGLDNQWVIVPSRKAPQPPNGSSSSNPGYSTDTLYDTAQSALSGIPFIIDKKYISNSSQETENKTVKSRQQIEDEYYYSFALERDIADRTT